jgi:1-acyl-sn-glycerol-3-phosphate acyltransferase
MFDRLKQKRPGTPVRQLLFYEFVRATVWVALRVLYRIRAYGKARLPEVGPVLLVSNHQSFLDPPAVAVSITRRHLDFVARIGLFNASGVFGWIISALNSLPIKEEGGDTAAIKEILRRLDKGFAVLIFPEGSRSETGAMDPFKRGVAVLVKRAQCPVIPVAVEGCFDAWPRDRRWPRLLGQRVAVAFGDPISHDELMARGAEASLERLALEVDRMRRALRRQLRRDSHGRIPAPGAGDAPIALSPLSAAG